MLRVFRRNKTNLIIIWNKNLFSEKEIKEVKIDKKVCTYEIFVPYNKNKFKEPVTGVIINQVDNKIDHAKEVIAEITFVKDNKTFTHTLTVMPALQEKVTPVYLLLWDDEHKKFEKAHGQWVDGKFVLCISK